MKLHTVHFYAPFVGGIVEDGLEFGVYGVAGCQRLVEFKFADDVAERGLRQLFYCIGQVVDLIDRLLWIYYLKVEERVDFGGNVVACNHLLRREIVYLFA